MSQLLLVAACGGLLLLFKAWLGAAPARDAGGSSAAVGGSAAGTRAAAPQAAAEGALAHTYSSMAREFEQQGLDLHAVASSARWFDTGLDPPAPLTYTSPAFPPAPLAPHSVRLLLVPLSALAPEVVALAANVSAQLQQLVPPGFKVFANPLQGLHVTVFHFSHPHDTRPAPLEPLGGLAALAAPPCGPSGGARLLHTQARQQQHRRLRQAQRRALEQALALDLQATGAAEAAASPPGPLAAASGEPSRSEPSRNGRSTASVPGAAGSPATAALQAGADCLPPPHMRPGPTHQQLQAERDAAAQLLAGWRAPIVLQLERVLVSRGGTLLLAWGDPHGGLAALRQQLAARFRGASSKQAGIIHTTLFRIVTTPAQPGGDSSSSSGSDGGGSGHAGVAAGGQLSARAVAQLSEACEAWTARLARLQLRVNLLRWTSEAQFSTVAGESVPLTLGGGLAQGL